MYNIYKHIYIYIHSVCIQESKTHTYSHIVSNISKPSGCTDKMMDNAMIPVFIACPFDSGHIPRGGPRLIPDTWRAGPVADRRGTGPVHSSFGPLSRAAGRPRMICYGCYVINHS